MFARFVPLTGFLAALVLMAAAALGTADGGPSLAQAAPPASAAEAAPALVVRFKDGVPPGAVQRLNARAGAAAVRAHPRSGLRRIELPSGADVAAVLDLYRASGLVAEAGIDRVARIFDIPNDPAFNSQWHLADTEGGMWAQSAWDLAPAGGRGVVVAVIDTGVAYETYSTAISIFPQHFVPAPDLAGVPIVSPWNFRANNEHAADDHGHGTHVTGTIAQATNNGIGAAGVAHGVSVMPIKVLDYSGNGSGADLVEAIYYAVENGARVINMSLGFSGTGQPDANGVYCTEIPGLPQALQYAFDNGVVVVAASGNDGGTAVACPAAYPTVIAVGATRLDGQATYYSNRGTALDISAPGGDPNVDQNNDGDPDLVVQQTFCKDSFTMLFTGDYSQFCSVGQAGTSMASPHVAGAVALLLGENGALTPMQVRYYLETTARDRGAAGPDAEYGWGALDARAALVLLGAGPPPDIQPPPGGILPPAPATPTGLSAQALSATSIRLTWTDNAATETSYRVERALSGSAFSAIVSLPANSTAYSSANLSANTEYRYRVRAFDAAGVASRFSQVATAVTLPPPAAPANLVVTAVTNTTAQLSWSDMSASETGFKIERSTNGGQSYLQVTTVGANVTTYLNLFLQPGTIYQFRVRAYDGAISSAYSNVATATTLPPPPAPLDLAVTGVTNSTAQLSWVDVSSTETGFRIERSTNGGQTFLAVATVGANATTYTNTLLLADTTYQFRVRAYEGTINSPYSNVASATTLPPPSAPSNLAAVALTASTVRLTWTDNALTETGFKLERSTDGGATYAAITTVGASVTTWTNSGLTASTTYVYRVRAYEGTANSAYSNVAAVTTLPPPAAPSGLTARALSATSIGVSWTDNATTETGFRIERSPDGVAGWAFLTTTAANVTSATNSFLPGGATYFYRVRAMEGAVNSDWSNVAVGTTLPPPATPSGLTATALSRSSIRLNWTDTATTETAFQVERSVDGVNWMAIGQLAANTVSWTNSSGLSPDTTYHYRVRAVEGLTAYSAFSNTASAATLP